MAGPLDPEQRRRAWISAALAALALLLVPFSMWLVLPAPPKIAIPQVIAATSEPVTAPPRPKPKLPAPAARRPETAPPPENTGPIHGSVLGPDGAPVARAMVACTDRDSTTVSDNDGFFELHGEVAAGCKAVAHKAGFGSSEPVTLQAGDPRANTLHLKKGGRIEGVVVDEGGAPVTKFTLAVEKFIGGEGASEGANGRSRTVEDEQGRFVIENTTPGKYVLSASAEGRPPARSEQFDVESGRSATGVRIVLVRGAKLSGVVTDAQTRKPIDGARVAFDSMMVGGATAIPATNTDQNGAFVLDGAPASSPFSVRVEKNGYRTRIMSGLTARGTGEVTANVELQPKAEGEGETELGGIGAVLGPVPGSFGAVVLSVMPDGPAARAGIQSQDHMVRIDGASTDDMTLPECIQRLRGEPGTRVTVQVKRGTQQIRFDLIRATVVR